MVYDPMQDYAKQKEFERRVSNAVERLRYAGIRVEQGPFMNWSVAGKSKTGPEVIEMAQGYPDPPSDHGPVGISSVEDEQQQRDEHDRELAARVVDLILAEDVFVSRLHADNKSRMIERIVAALGMARMDERAIKAGPVLEALEQMRTAAENLKR